MSCLVPRCWKPCATTGVRYYKAQTHRLVIPGWVQAHRQYPITMPSLQSVTLRW